MFKTHNALTKEFADKNPVDDNTRSNFWTCVEPNLEITIACLTQLLPLSNWFQSSVMSKFIHKEPDTWWHPSGEELNRHCNVVRGATEGSKRASSDRSSWSTPEYNSEAGEQAIGMREVREIRRLGDCTANAFGRIENV